MKLITHFCLVLRYSCNELYFNSLVCCMAWNLFKYRHKFTWLCLPTQLWYSFYTWCLYFSCDYERMLAEVRRWKYYSSSDSLKKGDAQEVPERALELQKCSKGDLYWEITHVKVGFRSRGHAWSKVNDIFLFFIVSTIIYLLWMLCSPDIDRITK